MPQLRLRIRRSASAERNLIMAKGQKKSNREIRKPKKEKPKTAPAQTLFRGVPAGRLGEQGSGGPKQSGG
jgi:hypothetical protein